MWRQRRSLNVSKRVLKASKARSFLSTSNLKLQRGEGCKKLQIGQVYDGFELQQVDFIPEYSFHCLQLEHQKTKAKYFHIDTKDTNNVFSVMFRTPPYNSNGIAHILEHTVLCGSKQFPVRDPFFNMIKRSLNTYMNALTAYDHTMYPFSTINEKDWKNLMAVYLDAVFFPNLTKMDFLQEGHRLEIDQDTNKLVYKGVVYNEMKGVLSDSSHLFGTRLQQELFKGTIYEHVSGGDPKEIPTLTYQELLDFHAKYYHPSNCAFYSYGDLPLTNHLAYLNQQVLHQFDYRLESANIHIDKLEFTNNDTSTTVNTQVKIIDGPLESIDGGGEASDNNKKKNPDTKFCMSQLFVNFKSTQAYESLVMRILSYLLTNGPSSPFYKALIESNLATDFSIGTGFDTSTLYPSFGIGVEGIDPSKINLIEQVIEDIFQQIATYQQIFDRPRLDALLHQIELSQKHIVGNFGMQLLHTISTIWCHQGQITQHLQLNVLLDKIKSELKENPRYFEDQVGRWLVRSGKDTGMDNTAGKKNRQVKLLMVPKETFMEEQDEKEFKSLQLLKEQMSAQELEEIHHTANLLRLHQQQIQQMDVLPTLTVQDIPLNNIQEDPIDIVHLSEEKNETHFVGNQTTNELSYFRFAFDTTEIPHELKWFVPLFGYVFGQFGTSQIEYDQLPTIIQNTSGGISCTPLANTGLFDSVHLSQESLLIETLCLPHKLDTTLQLMFQLWTDTQFEASTSNLNQLRILIQMAAANASNSISSSGHQLAACRSNIGFTKAAMIQEMYSGLSHVEILQQWAQAVSQNGPKGDQALLFLASKLQAIADIVLRKDNLKISVVTEDKLRFQVETKLVKHLLEPFGTYTSTSSSRPLMEDEKVYYASLPNDELKLDVFGKKSGAFYGFGPLGVNFVVKTLKSVPLLHEDHVPLTVLAQMMSSCFLHQQVREKGGAYGCSATQGEGVFRMSSYYDPNTWKTLDAYEKAIQWAIEGQFKQRDIDEALLSLFAGIDAPTSPSSKGKMAFLRGITHTIRQERRHQFLSVTKNALIEIARKHWTIKEKAHIVIIGKENHAKEFEQKDFHTKVF
jgi:Zn-dependent M16 (insulinase) family peptidase